MKVYQVNKPKKFKRKKERLIPYISHTANLSNWVPLGKSFVSRDLSCRGISSHYCSRQLLTNSSTEPTGRQKGKKSYSQARKASFLYKLSQKQKSRTKQKSSWQSELGGPIFFSVHSLESCGPHVSVSGLTHI